MNTEQKREVLEALEFYIPIAAPHKTDKHIELLEQVVEELQQELPPKLSDQDLLDDTF